MTADLLDKSSIPTPTTLPLDSVDSVCTARIITATAEDSCAALIHAADKMACFSDVVITLKCPDGSTSVRLQLMLQLRRSHAPLCSAPPTIAEPSCMPLCTCARFPTGGQSRRAMRFRGQNVPATAGARLLVVRNEARPRHDDC